MLQHTWKTLWQFLKSLSTGLMHDPTILPRGTYQEDLKQGTQIGIFTRFVAVVLMHPDADGISVKKQTNKSVPWDRIGAWIHRYQ